jgi:hypothetical protein
VPCTSPIWNACQFRVEELSTVFRQGEASFRALLMAVREGRVSSEAEQKLRALSRPLQPRAGVLPTRLFCRNRDVDSINNGELAKIPATEHRFKASDKDPDLSARVFSGVPTTLSLRVGAQVMLTKNSNSSLVNGSRGVVVGFQAVAITNAKEGPEMPCLDPVLLFRYGTDIKVPSLELPVVRFANGQEHTVGPAIWELHDANNSVVAYRMQIPLRLAWCVGG